MSRPGRVARLSLQERLVGTTLAVIAVVLVGTSALVFVVLRHALREDVESVLDAHLELVEALSQSEPPERLLDELTSRGVPASVSHPSGATSGNIRPSPPVLAGQVDLPDGRFVTVYASLAAADRTAGRLVGMLAAAALVGLAFAAALARRAARTALGRLEEVTAAARAIAEGRTWARVDVSAPGDEVGRLETAFDDMVEVLERALAEAQASSEQTQRFLADAAHQLRTPLAGIRASVELLGTAPAPEDAARLQANLELECERLTRLVAALLRMARIDQGFGMDLVEADLVEVCRTELDRVSVRFPGLGCALEVASPPPAPIDLDPASMAEAVANLLDNAGRHARASVTVSIAAREADLEVRIHDDGPGLDPAAAARAFERFATLDSAGGVGLGLPIAQGIIEAHHGSLGYERGAFVIRLPRERRRWPRPVPNPAEPVGTAQP